MTGCPDHVWSLREVLVFRVPPWLQPGGLYTNSCGGGRSG